MQKHFNWVISQIPITKRKEKMEGMEEEVEEGKGGENKGRGGGTQNEGKSALYTSGDGGPWHQ